MAVAKKGGSSLRAQVVTPRRTRRVKKTSARGAGNAPMVGVLKSAAALVKPAIAVAALVLLIWGYNAVADSSLFELSRIEVNTSNSSLRTDVEEVVRRAAGQTKVLSLDLASIREKVESLARVRSATVARVLPDALSVSVIERQPVALARRSSNALVWLDEDGVEIGDAMDLRAELSGEGQAIPPITTGFSEGNRSQADKAEDRERIKIYRRMEEEFKKEPNPLWNLLDEIDLAFTKHVKLQLANSPIMIHVGDEDFRNRFQTAIQVLSAIKQGDVELLSRFDIQAPEQLVQNADNISFIDVARADRIVLNFSSPGKEKKQ